MNFINYNIVNLMKLYNFLNLDIIFILSFFFVIISLLEVLY